MDNDSNAAPGSAEVVAAARMYEDAGFTLLKIKPRSKSPEGTWLTGSREAVVTADFFETNPKNGIGVVGGAASGIFIIDVDDRVESERYFAEFGIDISSYRKKTASFHRGDPNRYKLVFGNPERENLPYIQLLHTEFRGDDRHQDIFPPSIHESGSKYVWETGLDKIVDLPPEIRVVWNMEVKNREGVKAAVRLKPAANDTRRTRSGENVFEVYNRIIGAENALRMTGQYVQIGTRWKPIASKNSPGIVIYDGIVISSQHMNSDPMVRYINPTSNGVLAYTPFHLLWYIGHGGDVTAATAEAYRVCEKRGYAFNAADNSVDFTEILKLKPQSNGKIPEELLRIPGRAQGLVDAYNASAMIRQPQFAVHATLAVVATLMGRRFKTTKLENQTNFFFEIVGDSSSGKNHAKKFIKRALGLVDYHSGKNHYKASALIGGGSYKSYAGLFRACVIKPVHINIIDESGVKQDAQNRSEHGRGIKGGLLDVWSSSLATISKGTYSGGDITFEDVKRAQSSKSLDEVINPCVIIFGISTPAAYYGAMKAGDIETGYLGRHLIVESEYDDRYLNVDAPGIEECIDSSTLSWMRSVFTGYCYGQNPESFDPDIFMANVDNSQISPPFVEMDITRASLELFQEMHHGLIDEYGKDDPLVMKGMEMAVRISMMVAISCETTTIDTDSATWAIKYVRFYLEKMVRAAELKIAGSKYESDWKEIYEVILRGKDRGANERDLFRKSPAWRGATQKQQNELISTINDAQGVKYLTFRSSGGRKRHAWVAVEYIDPEKHVLEMPAGE